MPFLSKYQRKMKFAPRYLNKRHKTDYAAYMDKYHFGSTQAQRRAQAQHKMGYNTAAKKRMSGPRMRNGLYSNHYPRYTPARKPYGLPHPGLRLGRVGQKRNYR